MPYKYEVKNIVLDDEYYQKLDEKNELAFDGNGNVISIGGQAV